MANDGSNGNGTQQSVYVAREMAKQALSISEREARSRMAELALNLDQDCADAYTALAMAEDDPEEALPLLDRALTLAEQRMDSGRIERNRGRMWRTEAGVSYLLAREALGMSLLALEEYDGALDHLKEVLSLGGAGEDKMGISHTLLPHLLQRGEDEEVNRVLNEHPCQCPQHLYTKALMTFKDFGPTDNRANYQLGLAMEADMTVAEYLADYRSFPDRMPDSLEIVTDDTASARAYVVGHVGAWSATSGAIEWLSHALSARMDDEGEELLGDFAVVISWRGDPDIEIPLIASYNAALDALLYYCAERFSLEFERVESEGFRHTTVEGGTGEVAELVEYLLANEVGGFGVLVFREEELEIFAELGMEARLIPTPR